ncbi:MAG: fibronectin type III domain-containing protein [Nocardioidaceae bacterium]
MRRLALPVTGVLVAAGLLLLPTPPAGAVLSPYCADVPAPCIDSVLRDGAPVDPSAYSASIDTYTPPEDAHNTGFTMTKAGSFDMSGEVGHVFTVTMDTGTIKPRIVSGWGTDGHAVRTNDGDGTWHVTVTFEPAEMLMSCIGEVCPTTAPADTQRVEANVHVDDASWYADGGGDPEDLTGLDVFSNINLLWYPPAITVDPSGVVTMTVEMTNSHFYPDGSTVFLGHANIRLPNHVLRDLYGIPDPATMTPGSFVSTTTSGTVSSAPTAPGDAWDVVLDGVTFSTQHLRLKRGVIVPTRPGKLDATRVSGRKGKVWGSSAPRGALVRGYVARCEAGSHVVTARSDASPVVVTGLHAGRRYDCRVTAQSKAGPSKRSAVVVIPARP